MGWFDGLMSGFQGRHYALEAQQLREAELRNEREAKIFSQLLSSPDDEVKALAATGLLTSAQSPKRKGGFRGWLGEVETNPYLDQIKALIGTSKETVVPGITSTQYQGYHLPGAPNAASAAALPSSSPTEAGSAAMATPQPTPQPTNPAEPWVSPILGQQPPRPSVTDAPADYVGSWRRSLQLAPQPSFEDAITARPLSFEAVPEPSPAAEAPVSAVDARVGAPPELPVGLSGTEEAPVVTMAHPDVEVTAPVPEPIGTTGAALTPPEVAAAPPIPSAAHTTRTSTSPERIERTPRQIFQTPEGQMRLNTLAREEAEYAAEYNYYKRIGFSDPEIKAMLQEKARRAAGRGAAIRYQRVKGSLADGTPAFGTYDPSTGQFLDPNNNNQPFAPGTFQPSDDDSFGVLFNRAKSEFPWGNNPRLTPEQTRLVNDRVAEMLESEAYGRGTGTSRAAVERGLDKNQQATLVNQYTTEWLKLTDEARGIDGAVAKMEAGMDAIDRGDLGPGAEDIIVTFQKVLDKNSVVREAEAERSGRFTGLLTRVQGAVDNLRKGGAPNIPAGNLQQYIDLAKDIQKAHHDLAIEHRTRLGWNARYFQIPEGLIFGSSVLGLPGGAAPLTEPAPAGGRGSAGGGGRTNAPVTLDTPMDIDPATGQFR